MAYGAACSGAKSTMMPRQVTRDSTDHGAFDAALGVGWGTEGEQGNNYRSETPSLWHMVLLRRIKAAS
jgi:hypothetical protein